MLPVNRGLARSVLRRHTSLFNKGYGKRNFAENPDDYPFSKGKYVEYSFGDKEVNGVAFGHPFAKTAWIVLQEWWGVTAQLKIQAYHVATRMSTKTVIPDLYDGYITGDALEAEHKMSNLDFKNAVAQIEATVYELKHNQGVEEVGIIGFCMGGALATASTILIPDVKAGISFYGLPPADLCDPSKMPADKALQLQFGDKDTHQNFSDPASLQAFKANLDKSGCPNIEVFTYPEMGHAFMNNFQIMEDKSKELGYPATDEATIEQAWDRAFAFGLKHVPWREPDDKFKFYTNEKDDE